MLTIVKSKQPIKPCLQLTEEQRESLKKHQLEIFDHFVDFCQKHNLRYQLGWGTLLGAVRHKGFIPWDDDLDVCMPAEDYYRFINEYQDENGFHLDCREKDSRCWQSFAKLMKDGTVYEEYVKQRCDMAKGIYSSIYSPSSASLHPAESSNSWPEKHIYTCWTSNACRSKSYPFPEQSPIIRLLGRWLDFCLV